MATTMTQLDPIRVGFHTGNVITFLSHLYGTGFSVLREACQNSFDEGATKVFVSIHCKRRMIKVYDNGGGVTETEIRKKFENIGFSVKKDKPELMGKKGIGNLAGLAVAEQWQLISKKQGPFYSYTFFRKELEKGDNVNVYPEELPIKQVDRECPFVANSLLRLIDVSEITLNQLGDQDTIERTLREALSAKLRAKNIELRISYSDFKDKKHDFVIKPVIYRGAEMDMVKQDTPKGFVNFSFFHNPNPISNPSILVLHQGVYLIPLANFFELKVLPEKIRHLFFRGYFEGEIRLGFCSLNGLRSCFEHNDDLKIFVEAVTAFAEDVLRPIIEQFEQADREERWKRTAESVLKTVRGYFQKNPKLVPPTLKTMVFKLSDSPGKDVTVEVPGVGIRKPGASQEFPKKKSERTPLPPGALKEQKVRSEQKKRVPKLETTAPKRKVVDFSEGLGIQFVEPDMETDGFLWHSRTKDGVVQINIVNNTFLEVERRGQTIMGRYFMALLHKELTCASLAPVEAQSFDSGFELMMEHFWCSSL